VLSGVLVCLTFVGPGSDGATGSISATVGLSVIDTVLVGTVPACMVGGVGTAGVFSVLVVSCVVGGSLSEVIVAAPCSTTFSLDIVGATATVCCGTGSSCAPPFSTEGAGGNCAPTLFKSTSVCEPSTSPTEEVAAVEFCGTPDDDAGAGDSSLGLILSSSRFDNEESSSARNAVADDGTALGALDSTGMKPGPKSNPPGGYASGSGFGCVGCVRSYCCLIQAPSPIAMTES